MPVTIVGNNTPTAGGVVYGDGTNYASTAAGTSGQVLQSNGSSAPSWVAATSSLARSARTSNTILGTADKGTLIETTGANTYTQTITAAATLGSGWWCYVSNAGSGFVTLDPNGSETITVNETAQTTWILWPNEMGILVCDGSNFYYYALHKGEIVQTVSGAVASVSFATGLAYRRRMLLSADAIAFSGSPGNPVQFQINSTFPGSSAFTGGYLRTVAATFGGSSATGMTLSAGFAPLGSATANEALYASIQINPGVYGTFASGQARLINSASASVALTTMGAWDGITEASISTITISSSAVNITSGSFILREL